ncbi:MAG: DUF3180 domain-containing protein [Arachnia sp.]
MSEPDTPRLGVTTTRQISVAALSGAIIAFAVLSLGDAAGWFAPMVPWTVPAVLAVLAVVALGYARALPRRIDQQQVSADEGVRALVIGKSMSMTGAVLAGGHVVYVAWFVNSLPAPHPAARVVVGAVTILMSLAVAWAGVRLERACRVNDDSGEGPETPSEPA